ncbi:hypothetical protein ACLOJK_004353, partial [Asimina triloba]
MHSRSIVHILMGVDKQPVAAFLIVKEGTQSVYKLRGRMIAQQRPTDLTAQRFVLGEKQKGVCDREKRNSRGRIESKVRLQGQRQSTVGGRNSSQREGMNSNCSWWASR